MKGPNKRETRSTKRMKSIGPAWVKCDDVEEKNELQTMNKKEQRQKQENEKVGFETEVKLLLHETV